MKGLPANMGVWHAVLT